MKNKSTYLLIIFLFTCGNVVLAQTYKNDNSEATISNFSEKNIENNYLATSLTTDSEPVYVNNNSIFIQQIGDDNSIKAKTKSSENDMKLSQNGNNNSIYLDIAANTINEKVLQKGNENYFLDFSPYGVDFHSAEVVQHGNNQNITLFGGNSISEKIKINMQGDSKTVIVRNFN